MNPISSTFEFEFCLHPLNRTDEMPPRRSNRVVSDVLSATTTAKAARSKRSVVVSSALEDDQDSVDEAGGYIEEEEEDVKPRARRAPVKSRAKAIAPSKQKISTALVVSSQENTDEEVAQQKPQKKASIAGKTKREKDSVVLVKEEPEDRLEISPPKAKDSKAFARKPQPQTDKLVVTSDDEDETEEELQNALQSTRASISNPPHSELATPQVKQREQSETPRASITAPKIRIECADSDNEGNITARQGTPIRFPQTPQRVPITPSQRPIATPLRSPHVLASTPVPSSKQVNTKPRLTIHKLVLVNFKSYAGRQEIGPFHKSFSAIVGPNGSGKSNTIDALLFVFGYRASKMRQGKLSELIHNSAGHEGLESCSVEVWFKEIIDLPGVDNFLLVPNSQIVVNRTAYRNNSSKYTINDRSSTFTEVTTLLKGKGIDLDHNRFLILQGEVESIAQMKAKAQNEHEDGLLEYLEDIIGTAKYKEPIEQASLEVEALNDERGEKMSRLRVVEKEKASLENKKQEAEEYLRAQNNLTRKQSQFFQLHMHTIQQNLDITSKAIENLTAQLQQEQQQNAHQLSDIDAHQKDYEEYAAEYESIKKFVDNLVKDVKKFEKEEVGLQEKKKHLDTKAKKIKKIISDDGHAKSETASGIDNFKENLEKNRQKVTELEEKLESEQAELEEVVESLKDKTAVFTTQIEAKQRELEPWTAKISEKQSAIDVAKSERDLLAEKATGIQAALNEAQSNLQALKDGTNNKQEEYSKLKKELTKIKKAISDGEFTLESMSSKWEQLRSKVSSARYKADEAKASLAADKSENAVLSSLNKLRDQGRIRGFHGRLGDLGVIDDKYDVAVTTACPILNHLVVDTVKQGEACIDFLRKGNIGRANIMVLEKLPSKAPLTIQTPENVPRLFDMIKPKDSRFASAFYKGVGNTLVANDLEQAQRIGFGSSQRWRVVTLAGQLIDPSGTMSGGGNRVARGGMSSKLKADKVAPQVVASLEQESTVAELELQKFQEGQKTIQSELEGWKKRLPEIEMELEKIELDLQTAGKRTIEAEKRLAELQSQSKPDAADEKRIKVLDTEIAILANETDKLRNQSSAITEDIKSLQEKILEVGGVRLRAIQSKVSTTKGLLDLANESITKAEIGQAKSERDNEKLEKSIIKNKNSLEEVEAELEIVEGDLKACSSDLEAIRGRLQETNDSNDDLREALMEKKTTLDEKLEGINAFRALEMEIKQSIDDNARLQKENKAMLISYQKKHEALELVWVDDDEEDDDENGDNTQSQEINETSIENNLEIGKDEKVNKEKTEESTQHVRDEVKSEKAFHPRNHNSMELVEYSPDELISFDKKVLQAEIIELEETVAKARPNLNVLTEYRRREAEFLDRAKDLETVTSKRDIAKARYDQLRKVRLDEFMAGFTVITTKLKEMYQMITMGGNAEIELIDSMDPFAEGVVLSIMPPKKSWRAIANLSGGEKTLASLALVFALHVFKPTPLYFMDEIDAALDFKNVSIVANYIQSKTQAAQFIVISLRNDMFELAHRLVGIYKTNNCTKSVAIDNKDLRLQARPKRTGVLPTPGSMRIPPTPTPRKRVNSGTDEELPTTPSTTVA
ncbi:uncharacterized protein L203_102146 [Cryptococcus depauperatus CBS 7841]|uniref:Structural maintenance of chromosomes protein 4 n=1 Tax=Cryptococcus depauperatus CBS 7841 TaxID=1295531 RepID=A0AAJ8M0U6_9TREE